MSIIKSSQKSIDSEIITLFWFGKPSRSQCSPTMKRLVRYRSLQQGRRPPDKNQVRQKSRSSDSHVNEARGHQK